MSGWKWGVMSDMLKSGSRSGKIEDEQRSKDNFHLYDAVRNGDIHEVQSCLDGIPLQYKNEVINQINVEDTLTALHIAVRYGDVEATELLLQHGADINIVGDEGKQPIHYAAKFYKQSRKERKHHIDGKFNIKSIKNAKKVKKDCLQVLLEYDADVNARDNYDATPLHYACDKGYLGAVQILVGSRSIELEVNDVHHSTPLHEAARHGHVDVVKALLFAEKGKELVRTKDENGCTPLILACCDGYTKVTDALLKAANSSSPGGALRRMLDRDRELNTALHAAIESGQTETVKYLLDLWDAESGRLVNVYNKPLAGNKKYVDLKKVGDYSPLHLAADAGELEMLELLVKRKPNMDSRDHNLATPLHMAARRNNVQCVQFLLKSGCDVESRDNRNLTPLLVACENGHGDVLQTLLNHGANVHATDHHHRNGLAIAAHENHCEIVKILLSTTYGSELAHEGDFRGNTALHVSASEGSLSVLKVLADSDLRFELRNDDEQTPLHLAAMNDHVDVLREIVSMDRATLKDQDEYSRTPLHLAAARGHVRAVSDLVAMGANTSDIDTNAKTALDLSVAGGWTDCAEILIKTDSSLVKTKARNMETPLHAACKHGKYETVQLLLNSGADVTARLSDGRNPLDVAVDYHNESCAMALMQHCDWKKALSNATIRENTNVTSTPLRGLIENMPDVAEVVMNKCMSHNGVRMEKKKYEVSFNFEFVEDTYEIARWRADADVSHRWKSRAKKHSIKTNKKLNAVNDTQDYEIQHQVERDSLDKNADNTITGKHAYSENEVYNKRGKLSKAARPYDSRARILSRNHPLRIMVKSNREKLLRHPLVISLLNYKWRLYGRYFYWTNFLTYLLYVAALNVYMLSVPPRFAVNVTSLIDDPIQEGPCVRVISDAEGVWGTDCQDATSTRLFSVLIVMSFSCVQLVKEAIQCIHERLRYFLNVTNYLQLALYTLSIFIFVDVDPISKITGIRTAAQWQCGAIVLFLSWINLIHYVRTTPVGLYVFMATTVTKSFVRFSPVILLFLLSFAMSFYVLLQNQYSFYTPLTTLIKTAVMMTGEIDYSKIFLSGYTSQEYYDLVYYTELTYALFVIFLVFMCLLVTNLMVGIAVDDIASVQENAEMKRLMVQVDGVLGLEYALPEFIRRRWVVRGRKYRPNRYVGRNFLLKWFMKEEGLSTKHLRRTTHPQKTELEKLGDDIDSLRHDVADLTLRVNDVTKKGVMTSSQYPSINATTSGEELNELKVILNDVTAQLRDVTREQKRGREQLEIMSNKINAHQQIDIETTEDFYTDRNTWYKPWHGE